MNILKFVDPFFIFKKDKNELETIFFKKIVPSWKISEDVHSTDLDSTEQFVVFHNILNQSKCIFEVRTQ